MDNLCHTLVGAAIGECGARQATPLATATLLIGANLADIDALMYLAGSTEALGFRRGWTHGVLAVAVWPFVLAGVMLAWDRSVRRRRKPEAPPARPRALLALAALAVLTHPLLDLLNTYGIRLFMPFSGRWFYGDTLFIADPYVWITLLAAIWLSLRARRRGSPRPFLAARLAVGLVVAYIAAMRVSGAAAGQVVQRGLDDRGLTGARVVMSPAPADPLRWTVIVSVADGYALAGWDWTRRPHLRGPWVQIPARTNADFARAASATPEGRTYLRWSRLPAYVPGGQEDCPERMTCIRDARYYLQRWAQVAVPAAPPVSWIVPSTTAEELP
jgi:membrane-bound metal-dependent hydrolase YbcI (DUF457 family)